MGEGAEEGWGRGPGAGDNKRQSGNQPEETIRNTQEINYTDDSHILNMKTEARRHCNDILKLLKEKQMVNSEFYSEKIFFTNEGENGLF